MLEKIKNGLIIAVMVFALAGIFSAFKSCGKPDNQPTHVIQPLKTQVPTDYDKSIVPAGRTAIGVIKPIAEIKSHPWEKKEVKIIAHVDSKCNTCPVNYLQDTKTKIFVGFSFKPKLYLGYDQQLTLGYDQELFRVGRFSLDYLLTIPTTGLGIGYNLTDNFFIGAGANVRYLQYESFTAINTYKFDLEKMQLVYPIAYIGFGF